MAGPVSRGVCDLIKLARTGRANPRPPTPPPHGRASFDQAPPTRVSSISCLPHARPCLSSPPCTACDAAVVPPNLPACTAEPLLSFLRSDRVARSASHSSCVVTTVAEGQLFSRVNMWSGPLPVLELCSSFWGERDREKERKRERHSELNFGISARWTTRLQNDRITPKSPNRGTAVVF